MAGFVGLVGAMASLMFALLLLRPTIAQQISRRLLQQATAPISTRIVGGSPAPAGRFPYLAFVYITDPSSPDEYAACGGTLIGPGVVMTAAHCVAAGTQFTVNIGGLAAYTGVPTGDGVQYTIVNTFTNPAYDSVSNTGDIALLQLPSLSPIQPVALAPADDSSLTAVGTLLTTAGWGTTSYGGETSPTLQEVQVPVVSQSTCNSVYGDIDSAEICAGYAQGGEDSCQGDSGGPLLNTAGVDIQVGIVDFGDGCALPETPGVYTRVASWLSFINTTCATLNSQGKGTYCTTAAGQSASPSPLRPSPSSETSPSPLPAAATFTKCPTNDISVDLPTGSTTNYAVGNLGIVASDPSSGIAGYTVTCTNANAQCSVAQDPSGSPSTVPITGTIVLPLGRTTVVVTVTDLAGTNSFCQFGVVVTSGIS